MKKLADYKKDDGFEHKGLHHQDATDLLQVGFLGFCLCGRPEDNLQFVLDGMEFFAEKRPEHTGWDAWWEDYQPRVKAHFKSDETEYFFYYWLDKEGFTEHGGGVPGWLTSKGEEVLGLLREWKALQVDGTAQETSTRSAED